MKAQLNVPMLQKNNPERLVTHIHLFEKKVGPCAILSIKLIHNIVKVKIVLNNEM